MSNREAGAALATFSLVLGIFGFFCTGLPSIPAVILGHIALGHIGSAETREARGRAWAGLFLGYANIAIFGTLYGLMLLGFVVGSEEAPDGPVEAQAQPAGVESTSGEPGPAPPLPPAVDGVNRDDDVFLVAGDGRYHTFFCRAINDAQAQRTRLEAAVGGGFRPCASCQR